MLLPDGHGEFPIFKVVFLACKISKSPKENPRKMSNILDK